MISTDADAVMHGNVVGISVLYAYSDTFFSSNIIEMNLISSHEGSNIATERLDSEAYCYIHL